MTVAAVELVGVDVEQLTHDTADAVANRAARAEAEGEGFDDGDRRQYALGYVAQRLNELSRQRIREGQVGLSPVERQQATDGVMRGVFSLLPGLEGWLQRPDVTDIYVNGWDDVRAELVEGGQVRGEPFVRSDAELVEWIQVVGRRAGREKAFNRANPEVRTRLPDGSRFSAAYWVCERPYVAIRCHRLTDADLSDLRERRMFDVGMQSLLTAAVRARLNIMVAGDYGIGKTTLMRAMLHDGCAPEERIVVLEQEPELLLAESRPDRHDHVLAFTTREANTEGQGAFRYGDLARVVKWFRPRRVVVGEVQGPEVVDMMEVVTSGRGGAVCTIHADSSAAVFRRLPVYARIGGGDWKTSDIKELAEAAIDLVVYLDRASDDGRRVVAEVRQVAGYDPVRETVVTNAVYVPGLDGTAVVNPSAPMPAQLQERLVEHGYRPPNPTGIVHGEGNGAQP
jgi:pilus assembly protein CpaF